MKSLESRISSLEKKLVPQLPDKSVITKNIGSNIFFVNGIKYEKPDDLEDNEFLDELMDEGKIARSRVVVHVPMYSRDGL